jgi:hypothetical protein
MNSGAKADAMAVAFKTFSVIGPGLTLKCYTDGKLVYREDLTTQAALWLIEALAREVKA